MIQRITWFALGLVGIFFLPWYLFAAILLFGFVFFPQYYEGVLLAVIYDSLYLVQGSGHVPVWILATLVVFLLIFFIKPLLR